MSHCMLLSTSNVASASSYHWAHRMDAGNGNRGTQSGEICSLYFEKGQGCLIINYNFHRNLSVFNIIFLEYSTKLINKN